MARGRPFSYFCQHTPCVYRYAATLGGWPGGCSPLEPLPTGATPWRAA